MASQDGQIARQGDTDNFPFLGRYGNVAEGWYQLVSALPNQVLPALRGKSIAFGVGFANLNVIDTMKSLTATHYIGGGQL